MKERYIYTAIGFVPAIWLALLIAPSVSGGLPMIIEQLPLVINNPFNITPCEDSLKTVLIFCAVYLLGVGIYFSTRRNYRRGVEHGSAKWGFANLISKKYADKSPTQNKLLTENLRIGLDGKKHRRNLNVLIVGGSGAGKTRFYCKPNIMQANTSYVILDPKGEMLRDTGSLLAKQGYDVKVLDLINMERSHCYNPFAYIHSDNDAQKLVINLFKATTEKGAQKGEQFWDTSAGMLLLALIFYLKYEAPVEEQTFDMVMELLRAGEVSEDGDGQSSPLDVLFYKLEEKDPQHIAVKYYRLYQKGAGKTLKSVQITLAARLEKFNLESLIQLTATDELELDKLGERKTALFALISDSDSSFNFIVSMLYSQLFQQMFDSADFTHGGALPTHVHFVLDEFANVALPDDFENRLATMRSRNISVTIVLQNLAQLKALFEKQWESIVGNCDSFIYLGGNEQSTHKYVSELLGKQTIDTNTYGKSTGHSGNYSTNYQNTGRELLTADEVRMMDNKFALAFIRGERPVKDLKYDIMKHPNISQTTDGGGRAFIHGSARHSTAVIDFNFDVPTNTQELKTVSSDFTLLTEEELEEFFDEEQQKSRQQDA